MDPKQSLVRTKSNVCDDCYFMNKHTDTYDCRCRCHHIIDQNDAGQKIGRFILPKKTPQHMLRNRNSKKLQQ